MKVIDRDRTAEGYHRAGDIVKIITVPHMTETAIKHYVGRYVTITGVSGSLVKTELYWYGKEDLAYVLDVSK